jgi:hypothetical protein
MTKTYIDKLREPIQPDRVRQIGGGGFAFVPHRFLRDGFLQALDREPLALYLFLVLAANQHGVSFYGYDAICALLRMSLEVYLHARDRLIELDLIAFDGTRFQVLSLPTLPAAAAKPRALKTPRDFEDHDPATIRSIAQDTLGPPRHRRNDSD